MANIPVYAGSSSFFPGDTAFGFYDYQYQFQVDADATMEPPEATPADLEEGRMKHLMWDLAKDLSLEDFINAIYELNDFADIIIYLDQALGFVSRSVESDTDNGSVHTIVGYTVWESKAAFDAYSASVPASPLKRSGDIISTGKTLVGKDLVDATADTTTPLDIQNWIYWRWVINVNFSNIREYTES